MTKEEKAKKIERTMRWVNFLFGINLESSLTGEEQLDESKQIECEYSKLDRAQYVDCEILE